MEEKDPSYAGAVPTCHLPEISFEEIHKNIMRLFRLGNRVTLKILYWIRRLHEQDDSQNLSSRNAVRYIVDNLNYCQSEAYNVLKVAVGIPYLPHTAEAFDTGEISWSQVKPIVEIAKRRTEDAWIAYAKKNTVEALVEKVKKALEDGDELPSEEERGLPNVEVKLVFRFSREEREVVRHALELSAEDLKASRKDRTAPASPEESFLHLAKCTLRSELFGEGGKLSERLRSIFDILYQVCPRCEGSVIHTREGPVEVPHDHVKAIEGEARKLEIHPEEFVRGEALPKGKIADLEIPKGVQRKVLARYGHACARCGRRLRLHLHHIVFRCCGGPNEVWNLIPTCARCHSLVHHKTLEVYLDSAGELHWKSRADRIDLLLKEEFEELEKIPAAVIVIAKDEEKKVEAAPEPEPKPEPEAPPKELSPAATALDLSPAAKNGTAVAKGPGESEWIVKLLKEKLRYSQREAREMVAKALRLLSGLGREPTGDEVLNTAFRGRAFIEGRDFQISRTRGKFPGEGGGPGGAAAHGNPA